MSRPATALPHMLDFVRKLEAARPAERAALDADERLAGYLVLHFTWLGEAANRLAAPYKDAHPEVDWRGIINLRHRLVHDYEHIDYDVLWRILTEYVPVLRAEIERLVAEEDAATGG